MEAEPITWNTLITAITVFVLVSGALWGIWWRIENKVKEGKQAAYDKTDAAKAKADLAHQQLADFKTHVAEHYISKQGFRESMDSLSATLATINTNLTHLNERIDRVIDNQHVTPPTKRGGQQ